MNVIAFSPSRSRAGRFVWTLLVKAADPERSRDAKGIDNIDRFSNLQSLKSGQVVDDGGVQGVVTGLGGHRVSMRSVPNMLGCLSSFSTFCRVPFYACSAAALSRMNSS